MIIVGTDPAFAEPAFADLALFAEVLGAPLLVLGARALFGLLAWLWRFDRLDEERSEDTADPTEPAEPTIEARLSSSAFIFLANLSAIL